MRTVEIESMPGGMTSPKKLYRLNAMENLESHHKQSKQLVRLVSISVVDQIDSKFASTSPPIKGMNALQFQCHKMLSKPLWHKQPSGRPNQSQHRLSGLGDTIAMCKISFLTPSKVNPQDLRNLVHAETHNSGAWIGDVRSSPTSYSCL